ncbi:MAG: tRNA (guanine-N(1)-)-methyltransferase [Candidatus Woesebacteria bacterium GW2011_GWB1_38_5b]|uniref:tRNA (guanine-N(1)-)-methyltransferase n=1 Tax=Candidatus Woesebacteria bacterium GW2011_GWB1_38_5b TaxID=1618569 RepID=A0A0G0MNG4_9BACT|nr:MAG: tRNA (guanine-N(1)-)-methyltransferase [Candidatus Woesebacteria bacterium GW2011_GWB1_38_5b]
MKISVISLFPQMFIGPFDQSIIKNARKKKLLELNFVDLRSFGVGKHKTVDDKPYGGGTGMILKVDVLKKAIDATLDKTFKKNEQRIVLMDPGGKRFNQKTAKEYSKLLHLMIICGHYEGVDARIEKFIDEKVSIGDFVLTGGELGAIPVIDATARLISGVLKDGVVDNESFASGNLIEYPQYTRPKKFGSYKVPDILLSGNHGKIEEWKNKKKHSKR